LAFSLQAETTKTTLTRLVLLSVIPNMFSTMATKKSMKIEQMSNASKNRVITQYATGRTTFAYSIKYVFRDLFTSLRCVLGNPFKHNDKAQVRLRFQKQPTIVSQDEISFYLSKNTTSQQKDDGETDYIMRIKLDPMLKIETSTVNSGQFSYRLIPKDQQVFITRSDCFFILRF